MENNTRYEELAAKINAYTDKNFKAPEGFIIPLKKSVIFKKRGNVEAVTTEAGLIIPDIVAQNTIVPNIGVIYAVGPEVDPLLQPGQVVYVNQFANLEIFHKGEIYMMVDEREVYGILPERTFVSIENKSSREVDREKRMDRQEKYHDKKTILDLNELDRKQEIAKKKRK